MALKEVVQERIPGRIKKFADYRLFLVWLSETDAKDIPSLKKYLDGEIEFHQSWLRENQKSSRLGTKNRFLTSCAKYIDFLKGIRKRYMPHL